MYLLTYAPNVTQISTSVQSHQKIVHMKKLSMSIQSAPHGDFDQYCVNAKADVDAYV